MDWLEQILQNVTITDNKLDVEKIMKEAKQEFSKNAVTKEDYNNIKNQLNTANQTIKSLEGNMSKEDIETLKKNHKTEIKKLEDKYKTEIYEKDKNYALDRELTATNCRDISDIRALLNMDDIKYEDGKINGLTPQIEGLKKAKPYLFNEENNKNKDENNSFNPTFQMIDYNPNSGESVDTITAQIANAIAGN